MSEMSPPRIAAFALVVVLALALSLGSLSALGADGSTVGLLLDTEVAVAEFTAGNTGVDAGVSQVYDGSGVTVGNDGADNGGNDGDKGGGNDGAGNGGNNGANCVGNNGCSASLSLPLGGVWLSVDSLPGQEHW